MSAINTRLEKSYHLARHLHEKGVDFLTTYLENLMSDTQSTLDGRDQIIADQAARIAELETAIMKIANTLDRETYNNVKAAVLDAKKLVTK